MCSSGMKHAPSVFIAHDKGQSMVIHPKYMQYTLSVVIAQ